MGNKYEPTVKDNKLDQRYHAIARRRGDPFIVPGTRLPKKLTKKAAARLAEKNAET